MARQSIFRHYTFVSSLKHNKKYDGTEKRIYANVQI